ncbi:hypothetical protein [Bacillus paranthracis]|uniref:hypothetical protein n=1 Tax=Bacillus paranthracis TaxID=2026186 RepID=UPI0021CE29EC|nr:hypothetical protein [Bacillus paranthracis]MCU5208845.1 hypothetical protein [Bacillus paranthracis]
MSRFEGNTNEQAEKLYEKLKIDIKEEREHYSKLISRMGKFAIIFMVMISVNTFVIRNLYLYYFFNMFSFIFPCIGVYLYLKMKKYQTQIESIDDEFFSFYISNTEYLAPGRKERFLLKYQKAGSFDKSNIFFEAKMEELENREIWD